MPSFLSSTSLPYEMLLDGPRSTGGQLCVFGQCFLPGLCDRSLCHGSSHVSPNIFALGVSVWFLYVAYMSVEGFSLYR
jgi:hypothetical protein